MSTWRIAESLKKLREEINAEFPTRSKASDGAIGDARHQASASSDHNPHIRDGNTGVVSAIDITHDPNSGCTGEKLATALLESRDPRIKYIIWNRRIAASYPTGGKKAWEWRPYGGVNAHQHHLHISVSDKKNLYDSRDEWGLNFDVAKASLPVERAESSDDVQQKGEDVSTSAASPLPDAPLALPVESAPTQQVDTGATATKVVVQPATPDPPPVVKSALDNVAEIASTGLGQVGKKITWGTITTGGMAAVWAALQSNWIPLLIGFIFAIFLIGVGAAIFALAYHWGQKKKVTEAQIRSDPSRFNVKFEQ